MTKLKLGPLPDDKPVKVMLELPATLNRDLVRPIIDFNFGRPATGLALYPQINIGREESEDGRGWIERHDGGLVLRLRGKTGWREVEIARGSSDQTCPVHALTQWLHYARIDFGPLFVAVSRNGLKPTTERLSDKHIARLIKACACEAGLRPDLPEAERVRLFSGHSLRTGLASSAEVDERYVQKQLGHASAEMTRRYQRRRDRFRVNLTKAAGL